MIDYSPGMTDRFAIRAWTERFVPQGFARSRWRATRTTPASASATRSTSWSSSGARTELRRPGCGGHGAVPVPRGAHAVVRDRPDEKLYYCFGCGAGGDVFKFVMETRGSTSPRRWSGWPTATASSSSARPRTRARPSGARGATACSAARAHRRLLRARAVGVAGGGAARAYLAARVEEATLREFRIGYAPSAWDRVLPRARGPASPRTSCSRRASPRGGAGRGIYRSLPRADHVPAGRRPRAGARLRRPRAAGDEQPKYLNTPEGELFHKGRTLRRDLARAAAAKAGSRGARRGLHGRDRAAPGGRRKAVGLMGTALTGAGEGLADSRRAVLLCLDADTAGREAMPAARRSAASPADPARLRSCRCPRRDPADFVQRAAAEAMGGCRRAVPFARFEVERALQYGDPRTDGARRARSSLAAAVDRAARRRACCAPSW